MMSHFLHMVISQGGQREGYPIVAICIIGIKGIRNLNNMISGYKDMGK